MRPFRPWTGRGNSPRTGPGAGDRARQRWRRGYRLRRCSRRPAGYRRGQGAPPAGLLRPGAPGPVGIDSQAPGDRDQPGPGWTVLHIKVAAVGPGPQHGFLDEVLGMAAITAGQRGGQSQKGRPMLGVQAAERGVRVLRVDGDGLTADHDVFLRPTHSRGERRRPPGQWRFACFRDPSRPAAGHQATARQRDFRDFSCRTVTVTGGPPCADPVPGSERTLAGGLRTGTASQPPRHRCWQADDPGPGCGRTAYARTMRLGERVRVCGNPSRRPRPRSRTRGSSPGADLVSTASPGIGRIALLSPGRAPGIEARGFVPVLRFCGWPGRRGAGCGS